MVRAVVAVRFGKLFASLPLIHTICEPRYNTRHSTTDKLTISQDNKYLDYLLGLYIELGTYATGSLVISCENRANLLAELTIPRGTPRKKKDIKCIFEGREHNNSVFSNFCKRQRFNLKKLGQLFPVAIHFHPVRPFVANNKQLIISTDTLRYTVYNVWVK